jgi:beta-glucosidase
VSVFITGRPLWVNAEINSSDAFVVAWLPGTEGGGVADVLVADSDNNPRYDFTGRLSFDWPNKDMNSQNEALPVFDNLLQLGQGLSYGDETILSDSLSEVSAAAPSSEANIIFSGSSQEPWLAYVGDASDWHRQISGTQGSSPQGGLSVVTVDGLVQEDSRKLTWTGGHESQFYWQAASPADLTDLKSKNGALMMEFKVDQHPMGVVTQRMDCGWPCSGAIDMTEFFKSVPEGQLSRIGISLQCFDKLGVDLSKVTSPMVLVSEELFVLTIRDVRIVPDASQESMISCS